MNYGSPPPRTYVLIFGALLLTLLALLIGNASDTRTASAQTTSYDLCDRTEAVRDEILMALQYPNRDRGQNPPTYGSLNSSYPAASWGTFDTSTGTYTSVPCSSTNRLTITAAALASDAIWPTWRRSMRLVNKGITELQADDFVGLNNIRVIWLTGNSISSIPDNFFVGKDMRHFVSESGNEGLVPSCKWFGGDAQRLEEIDISNNGLRYLDIPHDAFDACNDGRTNPDWASSLRRIKLRNQTELGNVNLRWFQELTNLDGLELNDSYIDTYFYQDTPYSRAATRYTTGAKDTEGVVDWPDNSLTTRDALGTAIKAEINRRWTAAGKPGSVTTTAEIDTSGRVGPGLAGFNLCDPVDRHPLIADYIIERIKDPDRNSATPTPAAYTSFGCGDGETGHILKTALASAASWDHWRRKFEPRSTGDVPIDDLLKSDIKGLTLTHIRISGTSLRSLPDGIFEDANIVEFDARWLGGFIANPKQWFGSTKAAAVTVIQLANTGTNSAQIEFDEFDDFTSLRGLDLRGVPIGYVNTRWFERLPALNSLWLRNGTDIAKFFYDADGNDPYHGSTTGVTDFWDAAPLHAAITAVRTAYTTANSLSAYPTINFGTNYGPPDIAVDICDRPKVVWAEIMRNFRLLDDGQYDRLPDNGQNAFSGRYTSNAGDIRHARLATTTDSACSPVPGRAINKETMETVDPETTTFDADIHDRSIYRSGTNIDLRLYDIAGLGSTLDPNHFDNFYDVRSIYLDRTGIEEIPVATFHQASNLQNLSLSSNSLDDADFAGDNFLAVFKKLRSLTLSDNLLTKFESRWLPATARSGADEPLRTLRLSSNPITTVDVSGLDLTALHIDNTHVSELDDSIFDLDNLQSFWYWSPTLDISGLHQGGGAAFLNALPQTVRTSVPNWYTGNLLQVEDAELDAAAVGFSVAHYDRLKANNDADAGKDLVTSVTLQDPCRPTIYSVSAADWADPTVTGQLCLTESQKNGFIGDLSSFNAVDWITTSNADLTDAQVVRLLESVRGRSIRRLNLVSNPNAFGDGFDNSKLDVFDNINWRTLWQLRIVHSDLNFEQAQRILSSLKRGAYDPSVRRDAEGNLRWNAHYLAQLELSYNPNLFTDATPEDLSTFLNGVTPIRPQWGPFTLQLAGTGLDFDKFKAIVDSVEQYEDAPLNAYGIRSLDVSDNPNLWNRWDSDNNAWDDVPLDEIEALMSRLRGLSSLNIGDTGLALTELQRVFTALNTNTPPVGVAPGIDPALTRLTTISVRGTDLSGIPAASFGLLAPTHTTRRPAIRSLDLADTDLSITDLDTITDGLNTANVLGNVTTLNLSGNPDLFTGCDPEDATDDVIATLARYTSLRTLILAETGLDFTELQCVIEGVDRADGSAGNGYSALRTLSIANNPMAFTVPASGDDPATPATSEMVVAVFQAVPNARKVLTNTGLTLGQASAALEARLVGLTQVQQRAASRSFAAQNPAFTFKTPLPDDITVESGRGSLRVSFTHNPMQDGQPFTVLRYEFRYRVRPADMSTPWTGTGGQAWRTASLDLSETGEKSFAIYGLNPETIYQVQLRASSLALPATIASVGGTWTSLPEINEIKPAITEVSVRAGDLIRLEVDIYGLSDIVDNTLPDKDGSKLIFTWSDGSGGGDFADPGDSRRVMYTAPGLPGTYTLMVEAQPDGICTDHHKTTFDISDADRARCQATFTVRVSRAQSDVGPPPEPVNPAGIIPTSLTDNAGVAYSVFTPIEGGTFSGDGITVSAAKGAIPDGQLLGVSASVSPIAVPEPTPGTRLTLSGSFYDVMGVQRTGDAPVSGYALDDPLSVCLPLPNAFRANVSDIVIVNRSSDGSLGILSSTLRQSGGSLTACGSIGQLPATVAVAKTGVVEEPMVDVPGGAEPPPTGGAAPSSATFILLTLLAGILVAAVAWLVLGGTLARGAPRERV